MKKLYALEHWSDMGWKWKNYYSTFSFIESNKFPHELIEYESEVNNDCLYENWTKVHEVTKEFLENNFEYINFCHGERDKKYGRWASDKWTMDDVIPRVNSALFWVKRMVDNCKELKRFPDFVQEQEHLYCETRQYRHNLWLMYPQHDSSNDIPRSLATELHKLWCWVDEKWEFHRRCYRK